MFFSIYLRYFTIFFVLYSLFFMCSRFSIYWFSYTIFRSSLFLNGSFKVFFLCSLKSWYIRVYDVLHPEYIFLYLCSQYPLSFSSSYYSSGRLRCSSLTGAQSFSSSYLKTKIFLAVFCQQSFWDDSASFNVFSMIVWRPCRNKFCCWRVSSETFYKI